MNAMTPGDIDGDGKIGRSDLELLREVLEESGHGAALLDKLPAGDRARLDVNRDGRIDRLDVLRLCELMLTDGGAEAAQHLSERFIALRDKRRP